MFYMIKSCLQLDNRQNLMTQQIGFRINDETYLRLSALAAEKGLSVGLYVKQMLENQDENLVNDLKLIQSDTKDIVNILMNQNKKLSSQNSSSKIEFDASNEPVLLEILLLLREIAQPTKVSAAQKKVKSLGLTPYNYLEK